jgi:hypothetical protein
MVDGGPSESTGSFAGEAPREVVRTGRGPPSPGPIGLTPDDDRPGRDTPSLCWTDGAPGTSGARPGCRRTSWRRAT